MILLRRLRVHGLKHLRDIDIWFPRQGSVLIEGQNESGKSTLFEAIYFALYGAPLVAEEGAPSLASLIPHGESHAAVDLTVLAGETELEIHRALSVSAGKRQKHDAKLVVRGPGGQKEELYTVAAVNARILQEVHGLDGNALRNSCLMEQRALDRIESLSRDAREDAIARLLGLDVLRRAVKEFQPNRADETALTKLKAELEVAQSQSAAYDATRRESESLENWRAAAVLRELDGRDQLRVAQSELEAEILQDANRGEGLQQRVAAARRAEAMLTRADEIGRELSLARELGETSVALKTHISTLDAQVDDRLPATLARLTALSRLQPAFVATQQQVTYLGEAARLAREEVAGQETVDALTAAVQSAQHEAEATKAVAVRAHAREALERWLRVAEGIDLSEARARVDQIWAEHVATQRRYAAAREQSRMWLVLMVLAGAIALVSALIGVTSNVLWLITAVGVLATALFAVLWRRTRTGLCATALELEKLERALHTWAPDQGGGRELAAVEIAIAPLGMEVPVDAIAGRQLAARLGNDLPAAALGQSRADEAAADLERRNSQLRLAELGLEHARQARVRAQVPDDATPEGLDQERLAAEAALLQIQQELATLGIMSSIEAVSVARGAAEAELHNLRERDAEGERLTDEKHEFANRASELRGRSAELLAALIADTLSEDIPVGQMPDSVTGGTVEAMQQVHEALDGALHTRLAELDAVTAQAELAALAVRREGQEERSRTMREESSRRMGLIRELLSGQGISCTGQEALQELSARWSLLAEADPANVDVLREQADKAHVDAEYARRSAADAATRHRIDAEMLTTLNEEACQRAVEEAERTLRQRRIAAELADEAFTRIVRRVLPETEVHMRAVLPELTAGRYRDVQLLHDDAHSADLRIRVWDQLAGRYVAKSLFSGGTRDQCSLALRLAFTLATLPKELGAIPGFIFLDEPLSSFDAERSQALVHILTQGTVARHFSQVFLISHSQSFDPQSFAYRLNMAGGRVTESTLPRETEAQYLWTEPAAISQTL